LGVGLILDPGLILPKNPTASTQNCAKIEFEDVMCFSEIASTKRTVTPNSRFGTFLCACSTPVEKSNGSEHRNEPDETAEMKKTK
jgi:hypothetical protein